MAKNNDEMTKTSFRLSVVEKEELEAYADKNDLSSSQVIRRALREYMERNNNKDNN